MDSNLIDYRTYRVERQLVEDRMGIEKFISDLKHYIYRHIQENYQESVVGESGALEIYRGDYLEVLVEVERYCISIYVMITGGSNYLESPKAIQVLTEDKFNTICNTLEIYTDMVIY